MEKALFLAAFARPYRIRLDDAGDVDSTDLDVGNSAEGGRRQFADGAPVAVENVGYAGEGDGVDRVVGAVDPLGLTHLAVGWEVEAVIVVGGEADDEGRLRRDMGVGSIVSARSSRAASWLFLTGSTSSVAICG